MVESHPDNEMPDMRLDRPFPALQKYMDGLDLDSMDHRDHSHVPYLVILYKVLQRWIQENGSPPTSYRERKAFAEKVREG